MQIKAERVIPIEYFSIGMEDIEEEIPEEVFIPKYKKKIKYNIGDIVTTPKGRGKVITQPTEYGKVYTVHLTELDDAEIFEEKELKKIAGSFEEDIKRIHQQVQTSDTSLSEDEVLKQTVDKLKEEKAEQGIFIEPDEYSVKEVLKQSFNKKEKVTEIDFKDFIFTEDEKRIIISESDILGETQYITVGSAYKKGYDPVWLYIRFHPDISTNIFNDVLQVISKTFGYEFITYISGEKTIWINFMTNVTMTRIDAVSSIINTAIKSIKQSKKLEDIGFYVDVAMEVWLDDFDIKYDDTIEAIKKQNISLEEKITLGKDRAKELAQEQVNELDRQEAGKFGINIKEISVGDLKLDRIDWVKIFAEEEIEGSKKQAQDGREFEIERRTYYGEEETAPDIIEEKLGRFTLNDIEKNFPSFTENELTRIDELDFDRYTDVGPWDVAEGEATPEKPLYLYTIHRVNSKIVGEEFKKGDIISLIDSIELTDKLGEKTIKIPAGTTGEIKVIHGNNLYVSLTIPPEGDEISVELEKEDVRKESYTIKMSDLYRPDVTKTEWYSKGKEDKSEAPKVLSNYPNKALFDTDIEYQHALDAYWKGYGKSLVTSMLIYAVKIGWLRDDWISKTNKILNALEEVSDGFKEERKQDSGAGLSLFNYYSTSRYEDIERPLREEAITKSQARKLLDDLVNQFKIELFAAYGITNAKKVEEIIEEAPKEIEPEKEAVSMDDVIMYGDSNIYPYKGTGAGMPSSSDITRLTNEIPVREIRQL